MGLKFYGGPEREAPARIPAYCTFAASGPSGNLRSRRVHVRYKGRSGETIGVNATLPFYISNSSLGRSSAIASALASGTIAASLPFAISSDGGLELLTAGRAGL